MTQEKLFADEKKTEWKKKVKQRRELKGQGNLLSEEYRKEK